MKITNRHHHCNETRVCQCHLPPTSASLLLPALAPLRAARLCAAIPWFEPIVDYSNGIIFLYPRVDLPAAGRSTRLFWRDHCLNYWPQTDSDPSKGNRNVETEKRFPEMRFRFHIVWNKLPWKRKHVSGKHVSVSITAFNLRRGTIFACM